MKREEIKNKMAAAINGVEVLSWEQLHDQNNTQAKAFLTIERGETCEFFDGEEFEVVPRDLVKFKPKPFDGGVSLTIPILRGGNIEWMPLGIFRRTTGLVDEREILRQENTIGNPLRASMTDVARVDLLYQLVGTNKIRVNVIKGVHANRFNKDRTVTYDSADMDEKDRKPLRAYRFNLV